MLNFKHPQIPLEDLTLHEKILITSKIYNGIAQFFGHWEGIPEYDLESEFSHFVQQVINTKSRLDFYLCILQFLATLHNGHTWVIDKLLTSCFPDNFGIQVIYLNESWVVIKSLNQSISPGSKILFIDDVPMHIFYSQVMKYLTGTSERARRNKLWRTPLLFPKEFTLTLEGEANNEIKKFKIPISQEEILESKNFFQPEEVVIQMIGDSQIPYIKIPNFGIPTNETKAIKFVQQHHEAPALIFDLRGNTGGSTPMNLVKKLMNKKYRWYSEKAPMNLSLKEFNYQYFESKIQKSLKIHKDLSEIDNLIDMRDQHEIGHRSFLTWTSGWYPPLKDAYQGKIMVLIDRSTGSAAEDFVIPFKTSKRGLIVGERSRGSTGQPYMIDSDSGIQVFIGMKRAYYPDGSPFEGIGIIPDINVPLTREKISCGIDETLEKVISLCDE
ncbi:MAG: S41 family peptidase [Promethearchaeota archaeon]